MGQVVANILYAAAGIFIVGISFSVIFSTARFFHFAHAAVITAGAYAYFAFLEWAGFPAFLSAILAVLVGAGLGWCIEATVYRAMRKKGASALILLLASLGIYIVLQNALSMLFGDDTKIVVGSATASTLSVFGAQVTTIQFLTVAIAVVVFFGKAHLLDRRRLGLGLRAVADSRELAKVSGIDYDKTMVVAFCLGSSLAGGVGLLRAFDVGMTPTMGLPMLLLGVVAVVIAGSGRVLGIALASLLIAALQEVSAWQLGTQWEETAAFLLLLGFLLVRPQGIFGRPLQKAKV